MYLSHIIRNGWKGLRKGYVWKVSWRLNKTATYWLQALLAIAALLSRSPELLYRGPWGPKASSHAGILSPKLWLQLTELPVAPGYIIVGRPPASCGRHICTQLNPSTVKVIPWYLRPDAPVIYTSVTSPVRNTQQDTSCKATCFPSRKLYKLDESETQDTAG